MFSLDSYLLNFIGLILSIILFIFVLPTLRPCVSEKNQKVLSEANQLMQKYWTTTTTKPSSRSIEDIRYFRQAEKVYHQLIKDNKDNWIFYFYLGKSQRAFGHHLQAQATLAKAYQQMPEKVDVIIEYVLACLENHDLTAAYQVLKPAINSFPDSYLLKKQWVHFLLLSNKADLALKQLDIIKKKHPEDADMQHYRHLANQHQVTVFD